MPLGQYGPPAPIDLGQLLNGKMDTTQGTIEETGCNTAGGSGMISWNPVTYLIQTFWTEITLLLELQAMPYHILA